MLDVITFGSATRDVFMRSHEVHTHHDLKVPSHLEACLPLGSKLNIDELIFETGGGATNNAVTFSRMAKWKTAAVTRIGNDIPGKEIIAALKNNRVETGFVQTTKEEQTAYSTIFLTGSAERTILTFRGASKHLEEKQIPLWKIRAKLFYVSSLGGNLGLLKKIIARAKEVKAQVYINPGHDELALGQKAISVFKKADLVILNREETAKLTGLPFGDTAALVQALRKITPYSVLTDGPAGAYGITKKDAYHAAVIKVKRTNLTGAGDAFGSAFAVGLRETEDIRAALAYGTINATSVVQHTGAKVGILNRLPTKEELSKVKIRRFA